MTWTKTAEPIETPFGTQSRKGHDDCTCVNIFSCVIFLIAINSFINVLIWPRYVPMNALLLWAVDLKSEDSDSDWFGLTTSVQFGFVTLEIRTLRREDGWFWSILIEEDWWWRMIVIWHYGLYVCKTKAGRALKRTLKIRRLFALTVAWRLCMIYWVLSLLCLIYHVLCSRELLMFLPCVPGDLLVLKHTESLQWLRLIMAVLRRTTTTQDGHNPVVSSIFFPHLLSAVVDWMSAILPHMVWP